jgi:hypothetical protein
MIPRLGIEDDEALFAQGIYPPRVELYSVHIGRSQIPIMLMSYLGALKSNILRPIVVTFGPNVYAVREPMLLAGVASLWLFFLLLRRIAGSRAAYIGCALLAFDSLYLLTSAFDWGPVALQHLLIGGGVLLFARFFDKRGAGALFGSAFLFGLAIWDKALATWMLSGLALGAIVTFPRQIVQIVTAKRVGIAVLGFCLGASPLIAYNLSSNWGTFEGNFQKNTADLRGKAVFLAKTFSGDGLFGWMTEDQWRTPQPAAPRTAAERASAAISAFFGRPHHSLFLYTFLLSLLVAPFAGWTRIRLILLALIAMTVAWFQMAINQNTGGTVHHTILLWPLPQFIVAISLSAFADRFGRAGIRAVAVATAITVFSSAVVMNEYFIDAVRNGGAKSWTDAIYSLARYLRQQPSSKGTMFSLDWGIDDQLRLLERGKLRIAGGSDQISKPVMSADEAKYVRQIVGTPANVFIAHTKDYEFFPGYSDKLVQFAAAAGFRRETLAVIPDSLGRNVYEVYRFTSESTTPTSR